MSNNSQGPDARVAQVFFQMMAKHGVAAVKNAFGRVGSLAVRDDGQVVHFGLQVVWLRQPEREKLWAAAGLPGSPGRITGDDVLFFQELMRALTEIGLGRVTWNDDTKVLFMPDPSAPSGMAFRLRDLNCMAQGEGAPGLHL